MSSIGKPEESLIKEVQTNISKWQIFQVHRRFDMEMMSNTPQTNYRVKVLIKIQKQLFVDANIRMPVFPQIHKGPRIPNMVLRTTNLKDPHCLISVFYEDCVVWWNNTHVHQQNMFWESGVTSTDLWARSKDISVEKKQCFQHWNPHMHKKIA